jgi:hypothetical protein
MCKLVIGLVPALHDEDDFHVFGTSFGVDTCIPGTLTCAFKFSLEVWIIQRTCNKFTRKRFVLTIIITVNFCLGSLFVLEVLQMEETQRQHGVTIFLQKMVQSKLS